MIGTVLSGRYRLESKLGSGGMSTVYLALDETLDRPVAVKVLHREISDQADQLERFRREARAAARLSHPNLVAVIDAGEDGGTPYIVFEYVPGDTLKQRIQREGPLAMDESVAYAIEIGRGLSAAHVRKLVHRDVKPQNVLIDSEGRAKVTDFGIAFSLESEGLTATGRVLGTTDYVSPEQAMGENVDDRTDVYSLGIVLYEMLTGRVPFAADTLVGVAMKHVHEPMPDVLARRPDASATVAAIVDRATIKEPERRYQSVAEMVDDLEAALQGEAARSGGTSGEATAVLRSVDKRKGGARASRAGILMGLIGIGLIVAALVLGGSGRLGDLGGDSADAGDIRIESATDFDPAGSGGDGEEGAGSVQLAVDRNPSTAWSTETYQTEDFGGLGKQGVGLFVDTGREVEARAIEIRSAAAGWDAEIRIAPGATEAPEALEEWKVVTEAQDIGTRERIDLPGGEPSRFYLIWTTKPAPTGEGASEFRVEINDVKLFS